MAGAVAFVFGLCALSFAAGCVVTAIMLRTSAAEEEVAQPQADPIPLAPQPEQLELRWPDDHFTAKPIHRNPVVSRPTPAALALADRVEVVEEVDDLADELPELRPERLAADGGPVIVSEVRPEGESDGPAGLAEGDPGVVGVAESGSAAVAKGDPGSAGVAKGELGSVAVTEGESGSVGVADGDPGSTGVAEGDPGLVVVAEAELIEADPAANREVPAVGAEAARFFLAYAARQNAAPQPEDELAAETEQTAVLAAEVPGGESDAESFGLASWFATSDPEPSAEVQPVEQPAGETASVEPVIVPVLEKVVPAVPTPRPQVLPHPEQIREASSRKGKRREIKLELVPQPPDAVETENAPKVEPAPAAEQVPTAEVSASEPETVFASRSGLVVEAKAEHPEADTAQPKPDEPEPNPAQPNPAQPDPEAVVPEQGARPEPVSSLPVSSMPVSSLPVLVPTDEFRRRYLRTFEAARRRSSR